MSDLVQIDNLVADAVHRGGDWIACRPGCADCCLGPFDITPADAARLRQGLLELTSQDPLRAARLQSRLALPPTEDGPCPALDPTTLTCDLYAHRPVLCRLFGPALSSPAGIQACELCFDGATPETIQECAVPLDVPLDDDQPGLTVALALTALP